MRFAVGYGLRFGELYSATAGFDGLAIWYPPSYSRASRLYRYTRQAGWTPGRWWFLWLLAVDKGRQGQGYARRLLEPMLERIEKEGLPCFLDTQKEGNVQLYRHFEFQVAEKGQIPGTQGPHWLMVRPGRLEARCADR